MAEWSKYVWPLVALGHGGLCGFSLSQGQWLEALWFGLMAGQAMARTVQVWSAGE